MITIDGINFNLVTAGVGYRISSGFKMPDLSPAYQFDEGSGRPVLLPDAQKKVAELAIPIRIYGGGEDEILEQYGRLGRLQERIARAADTGGMTATLDLPLATFDAELDVLALAISDIAIDRKHLKSKRADCTVTIWYTPMVLGPWETAGSGTLYAGMPAFDPGLQWIGGVVTSDESQDVLGPARITFTNEGSTDLKFFAAALSSFTDSSARHWQPASALDYSTAPLDGAYTAGTNEVQRLTKSGTISGGTWPLQWENFNFGTFAHNASVATVQAAITAQLGAANIVVSGSPLSSGNMTFTFGSTFAGRNVAPLVFDGSALTGGGTVTHSTITSGAEAYVSTTLSSDFKPFARTPDATDDGSFELWALVQDEGSAADAVHVRARWFVGDPTVAKTNIPVTVPAQNAPIWVYLGDAHITPLDNGTHGWGWEVEAKTVGTLATELRVLDTLKMPIRNGRIRVNVVDDGTQTTVLSDDCNQTAGSYTGKSMDIGGAVSGGGDLGDLTLDTTNHRLQRADTADTADTGRHVYAGSNMTDSRASVLLGRSTAVASGIYYGGLILRFVDANNFAFLGLHADAGYWTLKIRTKIGGAFTTLSETFTPVGAAAGMDTSPLIGEIRSDGLAIVRYGGIEIAAHDAVFDTGALATGKAGLYDEYRGAAAFTRYFDQIRAYRLPAVEAAIFAGRDTVWNDDGRVEREAAAGGTFAYARNQVSAGAPSVGPAGVDPDTLDYLGNDLTFIRADQNPNLAASTAQAPRVDFTLERRRAFVLGRHPG